MLPPPGYSINDLITVAGWVKNVYDAFFHEFKNADSQLEDLARDVDIFQEKLRQYQQNLAYSGREDPGKESVRKTLIQCASFLDEYKSARKGKDGRRKSFMGKVKTGLFATEEEELKRLRSMLNEHKLDMVLESVNMMSQGHRSRQMLSAPIPIPGRTSTSPTIPIPGRTSNSPTIPEESTTPISPPTTPNMLLGSPLLGRGSFDPAPARPAQPLSRQTSFDSEAEAVTPSQIIPRPAPIALVQCPSNSEQQSTTALGFSLPEPVKLHGAGEVSYGPKKKDHMEFSRKPIGSDYERGRQIEIRDQIGKQCFRHRIRISPEDSLYPYTCHTKYEELPGCFSVKLKEAPPPQHKISRNGGEQVRPASIPVYIFTDERDYEDFQAQVRGKLLEGMFEVEFINSALSSKKKHEASSQHLKIWRDRFSKECSVSYYASSVEKPGHVEYPISMFQSEVEGDSLNVRLNFIAAASTTPKKARSFSTAFSKSPTESSSSTATKSPRIFDRTNSGMFSASSSMTSAPPSRMSVASSNRSGSAPTPNSDNESALVSQAKRLKFLDFEFSDETGYETTRFKTLYKKLREETISTGLDRVIDWQVTTRPGRPESVMSTSPRGTPYTRSPEMRASANQPDSR